MREAPPPATPRDFVPALGRPELTGLYDRAVALLTRERRWRASLMRLVAPKPGEIIVDVGCGTGSFAILLKQNCPAAKVIGIDPDPSVLRIARAKADKVGVSIEWCEAMGDEIAGLGLGLADKTVSSLVLHQCPLPMKRAIVAAMLAALRPGGAMVLADYGAQRSRLMRLLFRQIQQLDGYANTQPNADGVLPAIFAEADFEQIVESAVIVTPTGSISIYSGAKSNLAAARMSN